MGTELAGPAPRTWIPFLAGALAVLAVAVLGDIEDYRYYGLQWLQIVQGGNPWFDRAGQWNGNAYGPLHTILAWPYAWWHKLPRLIIALTWVGLGVLLFRTDSPQSEKPNWAYLLLFWASPFLWSEAVRFSHTDVLVAALALGALLASQKGRTILSALLLAAAISMKFYPVALLPFFAVQDRKLQWRWIAACAAALAVVWGGAFALWGSSVWHAVTMAGSRPSTPFSLFYFLKSPGSPLRLFSATPDLDWLSMPLLVICGAGLWVTYVWKRWPLELGVVAAYCLVLVLYKVGHDQFATLLYIGALYLWWQSASRLPPGLRTSVILYCAWMSLSAMVQIVLHHYNDAFGAHRWLFCVPTAAAMVFMLVSLIRWAMTSATSSVRPVPTGGR